MAIFVTSDLHFGHQQGFLFEPRGFTSIEEHDAEVIRRWNSIVQPEDTVYILGDLMLNDNWNGVQCIGKLNGHLKIVLGNHDTDARIDIYKGGWLHDIKDIEILGYSEVMHYKKYRFFLSHYPTLCGNYDDKGLKCSTINLCGHSHTKDKWADWDKGIIYHCELDAHDCRPVLIDDILDDLREKIAETRREEE